jgi:plastocyanin
MRHFMELCVLVAVTMAVVSCARIGAVSEAKKTLKADRLVTMSGFDFVPGKLTIRAGQSIEWSNTATLETHTVTADPKLVRKSENVALPAGAEPFNSGDLRPGQVFRHTFTVPGTYRYFCIPHERMGMIGEVEVLPAGS